MKKQNLFHTVVFLGIAAVYCFPVFSHLQNWGQMEWDQFTFWNAVPRTTFLEYHQFPLWNPYANGGNVLLAHPHSVFLSPFYFLVLVFGPVLGLKIEILVHVMVGLGGMYALARYLSLDKVSAYFAAVVFMLNSMYALHLTEGHTEWLAMAFVPWLFIFLLKSFKDPRQALAAAIALSFMLLSGSVDVLSITVVLMAVYVLCSCVRLRNLKPVLSLAIVLSGAFALCSIKLLPMLEFISQYPRLTYESSATSPAILFDMLLGRQQAYWDTLNWGTTQKMGLAYGWHEYGAYVGWVPLILFAFGAVRSFKEHWPLFLTGVVSLLIALGRGAPVDLWQLLHQLPLYDSLTVPSRFIFGFIFSLSLLSGIGSLKLREAVSARLPLEKRELSRWLGYFILLAVFIDLWSVNAPIFRNAFPLKPLEVKREDVFRQRYAYINFHEKDRFHDIVGEEISNSSMYPIFLSNSGILEGNEVMRIPLGDIKVSSDPQYRGEVYLANDYGEAELKYFSPNRIIADVRADAPDAVVLNQNFHSGWMGRVQGKSALIVPWAGLVSVPVQAGQQQVEFYYLPYSFLTGLFLSLSSLCLFYAFLRARKYSTG